MKRVRAMKDGRPLAILGLSKGNLGDLHKRHPILVAGRQAREIGLTDVMLLYYGETDDDMTRELERHGLLPPVEEIRVRRPEDPRPFEVQCVHCGTKYLNTDSFCPSCQGVGVRFDPGEGVRYQREVDELNERP